MFCVESTLSHCNLLATFWVSTSDCEAKSINNVWLQNYNATSSEDFSKIQQKFFAIERFLLTSFEKFEHIFFSFVFSSVISQKRFLQKRKEMSSKRYGIFMFYSILRLFSALERNLTWNKVFDDVTHLKKSFPSTLKVIDEVQQAS